MTPQSGSPSAPPRPSYVVAVGASAGGLEALEALFGHIHAPSDMTFVVLQHLSPDFESRMDELLGRRTSLPVQVASNGIEIEAGHVYLIPPKKDMIISGSRLLLTTKDPERGLTLPIDHFMRSLAADVGPRAIAIILSGSGSDGTRGVQAVADAGGLVLCQQPETARFDSMPRSALQAQPTAIALAPGMMAAALQRHADSIQQPPTSGPTDPQLDAEHREVFGLLRNRYGIDFSAYKPSTIERRIERRISMMRSSDLASYLGELRRDPAELNALYHDLLIGVTRFFRDPEAFRVLEAEVVPGLVETAAQRDRELRAWVPGCATGEEAYTLAMLLLEGARCSEDVPSVKVFATDVHRASLESASLGFYSEDALTNVSAERRKRWFQREGDRFRVRGDLRRAVVFAPHNVIVDAPFTRLDLVSCRNLLIYLLPAAQRKALSLFHFGMRTGGVLMLGASESPGELGEEFEAIDARWRIYRKARDLRLGATLRLPEPRPQLRSTQRRAAGAAHLPDPRLLDVYDLLLSRHMPPALLVDDAYSLLHSFGGAERMLHVPAGRPTQNVLDLVGSELKTAMSGAMQHAEKEGRSVRYLGLATQTRRGHERFTLRVEPVQHTHSGFSGFLLVFEPQEQPPAAELPPSQSADSGQLSADYIRTLEGELRYTRENLQATVEELETSNEELQASNEELVASNEELQSTNEELQSVNEELHTVNAEYERKIVELSQVNDDIDNLLHTTQVAVVFLDDQLRIRRFTAHAAELFGLLPHDIGREFAGFALRIDDQALMSDARCVLDDGEQRSREVCDHAGRRHLLRILPYQVSSSEQPGVLLSLIDVEQLKRHEARASRLSAIVESSDDAIISQDLDGKILTWNAGATNLLGYDERSAQARRIHELIAESERSAYMVHERSVHAGEGLAHFETQMVSATGETIDVSLTLTPVHEGQQIRGTSLIARDIRGWKRAEGRIRQAVHQREQFLAMLSHELRNPLAALLHASRVLDEDISDGERDSTTQTIRRQVEHMARLLDDLLDVSRIRQGKIEMRPEPVAIEPLLTEACATLGPELEARELELRLHVEDPKLVVRADSARLRQVVVNLVANAAKFSPPGRSIEVRARRIGDIGELAVIDQGMGLSPDELDEIFEPFVQGRRGAGRGGLGLGLALVRSIVEAHDGQITAHSGGPTRGSRFIVRLPVSQGSVEDGGQARHRADSGVRPGALGRRLVLIEDDEDGRVMLATLLRAHGFEVFEASDGSEGIAAIIDHRPDIALVDLGLPDMHGLEVGRRAREHFDRTQLQLIALTGFGQQSDREAVFAAGFDHHLVKPVDTAALEAVMLSDAGSRTTPSDPGHRR